MQNPCYNLECYSEGKWENVFSISTIYEGEFLVCPLGEVPILYDKGGDVVYEFMNVPPNCVCASDTKGCFASEDRMLKVTEIKKINFYYVLN